MFTTLTSDELQNVDGGCCFIGCFVSCFCVPSRNTKSSCSAPKNCGCKSSCAPAPKPSCTPKCGPSYGNCLSQGSNLYIC